MSYIHVLAEESLHFVEECGTRSRVLNHIHTKPLACPAGLHEKCLWFQTVNIFRQQKLIGETNLLPQNIELGAISMRISDGKMHLGKYLMQHNGRLPSWGWVAVVAHCVRLQDPWEQSSSKWPAFG